MLLVSFPLLQFNNQAPLSLFRSVNPLDCGYKQVSRHSRSRAPLGTHLTKIGHSQCKCVTRPFHASPLLYKPKFVVKTIRYWKRSRLRSQFADRTNLSYKFDSDFSSSQSNRSPRGFSIEFVPPGHELSFDSLPLSFFHQRTRD